MKATHNALLAELEAGIERIDRLSNVRRARLLTNAAETLRVYQQDLPPEAQARYASPRGNLVDHWLDMARGIVTRSNRDVADALAEAVETLRVAGYLRDRMREAGGRAG